MTGSPITIDALPTLPTPTQLLTTDLLVTSRAGTTYKISGNQIGSGILDYPLTGFSIGPNEAINSDDSILSAFEKTQGQINQTNSNVATKSPLVGSTNIVTVGTISTGRWQGDIIETAYGGTGIDDYSIGDLLYGDSPNKLSILSGNTTSSMKILAQTGTGSTSNAPVWSDTITNPLAAGATKVVLSDQSLTTYDIPQFNALKIVSSGVHAVTFGITGTATAQHNLFFNVNDGDRLISLGGNLLTYGAPISLVATDPTTVTLPIEGTLATLDGTEDLTNKTINKLIITPPASYATLTIEDLKTLDIKNSLSMKGTDNILINFGSGLTIDDLKTLHIKDSLSMQGTDGALVDFGAGGTVLYEGSSDFKLVWTTYSQTTADETIASLPCSSGTIDLIYEGSTGQIKIVNNHSNPLTYAFLGYYNDNTGLPAAVMGNHVLNNGQTGYFSETGSINSSYNITGNTYNSYDLDYVTISTDLGTTVFYVTSIRNVSSTAGSFVCVQIVNI